MQALAGLIAEGERAVFRKLASLAIELCGAGSAGVSVAENPGQADAIFRWKALAGVVAPFEGGQTPRNWSPCGACLDRGQATLYSYPERHFTYLQALGVPIVEGLVVPMLGHGKDGSTIWIVSHRESDRFDAEDVRVMTGLGSFAARALALAASSVPTLAISPVSQRESVWQDYVLRVARAEPSALTALFNETSPLVFASALRIVGLPADAEEVTADVYARIWSTAGSYNPARGGVGGWLRTIARSMAFDRLRSSALRVRHEVTLRSDYSGATDIEDDLIAGQCRERVRAALRALPDPQRHALELAYLSGFTCREIAATLDEPVGTVKTRLRLGLIKLRRLLAATS